MNDENIIQDVDFVETKEQKNIRGSALYYSTGQVAQILGIPDSTVRYYQKVFEPILNVEIINTQRKYTQADIDKLKFIVDLKNDGMTVKQILEYCDQVDFDTENGIQIRESNPLSIQTLAKALLEEQKKEFTQLKEELFNRVDSKISEVLDRQLFHQDKLKELLLEEISISVDDVIADKFEGLENGIEELKEEFKISCIKKEEIEMKKKKDSKIAKFLKSLFE